MHVQICSVRLQCVLYCITLYQLYKNGVSCRNVKPSSSHFYLTPLSFKFGLGFPQHMCPFCSVFPSFFLLLACLPLTLLKSFSIHSCNMPKSFQPMYINYGGPVQSQLNSIYILFIYVHFNIILPFMLPAWFDYHHSIYYKVLGSVIFCIILILPLY